MKLIEKKYCWPTAHIIKISHTEQKQRVDDSNQTISFDKSNNIGRGRYRYRYVCAFCCYTLNYNIENFHQLYSQLHTPCIHFVMLDVIKFLKNRYLFREINNIPLSMKRKIKLFFLFAVAHYVIFIIKSTLEKRNAVFFVKQ